MKNVRIDTLDVSSPALLDASLTLIVNAFGDPERYGLERVRRELKSVDPTFYRQFFVAMAAGSIVGFGGVKAADWASNTHILYLSAVAPEHRGQGIARALIKARIDWLKANFEHGRILVSAAKTKRFRDFGFAAIRKSAIEGRQLLIRKF
ncbi:MAG: N-acetyltransferase [Proteobacteria bacterium]|nr:N-acetyltransferase [Pseudomonadota bacterium]